jgi:hypothetical protein
MDLRASGRRPGRPRLRPRRRRQHFTGRAIEKLNEDRGADPRVRICTGAAQLAEWATARIAETNGQIGDVSSGDEVGRELIEEVHEALGILFAAGYNGLGDVKVPEVAVPPGLTGEDKADPLGGAAVYLGEIAQQASYLRHTVATVDLPHVQAIQRAVDLADELVAAVRSMSAQVSGPVEDPAADPPLWATANAAMVELFRAVRCLPVEDVARLDQSKVLDARRSMEWVENMPTVLWPPLSIDDEEPF